VSCTEHFVFLELFFFSSLPVASDPETSVVLKRPGSEEEMGTY
jgi:hypothetical protein